jgi:hypothetical protein
MSRYLLVVFALGCRYVCARPTRSPHKGVHTPAKGAQIAAPLRATATIITSSIAFASPPHCPHPHRPHPASALVRRAWLRGERSVVYAHQRLAFEALSKPLSKRFCSPCKLWIATEIVQKFSLHVLLQTRCTRLAAWLPRAQWRLINAVSAGL